MEIQFLADHPEHVPTLAQWIYGEWGHFDPENSLGKTTDRLRARLNRDTIPLTFIALENDTLCGCVSIKYNAMKLRPNYNPWLGSLFVDPPFRDRGIGSALVRHLLDNLSQLEISSLYLWTETAVDFYFRFGFSVIEEVQYLSQDAKIMRYDVPRL